MVETLSSISAILRGSNATCANFTLEQNNSANLRGAFILSLVAIAFVGWQFFNWAAFLRCLPTTERLCHCIWVESWSCGLAADSTSNLILNGGLGATVAATLCYNQVLTAAAQLVALAAFSHALSWNFVEKLGESVAQIFGLFPLGLASYVLWVQQSQHDGWDWESYPRGYIIMGLAVEGVAVISWMITLPFLHVLTATFLKGDRQAEASMPNRVWVDGASAVALQRARLIKSVREGPFKLRVVPILICSVLATILAAVFAGKNMVAILNFWQSSSEGQREIGLGVQPYWYKFAAVMTLVAFITFTVTIVFVGIMLLKIQKICPTAVPAIPACQVKEAA